MIVYWAMILIVAGMYTMYIAEKGFSKEEIGIAVTLSTLASLIGQSLIGYLVDKLRCIKKIMLTMISLGLLASAAFPFATLNWHYYAIFVVWGFCIYGTIPLTDAWCMYALKEHNEQKSFGKIRGFGSLGYGLTGAITGLVLGKLGWRAYPGAIIAIIILALFVISRMDDPRVKHRDDEIKQENKPHEKISLKEAFQEIWKIKPLMGMVVIVFMYTFVVRGIYGYLGILVADFGGGAASLGFTYFFDASPEIITFILTAALLKRFHSKNIIFFAFLLQIIRLSVILIFNNAMAIMLMGVLSGFAYGLLAASYKTYIYELAPARYKASCMSLSESLIGLAGVVSAPVFGFIFAEFGTNGAILSCLVLNIIIAAVLLKDFLSTIKGKVKSEATQQS